MIDRRTIITTALAVIAGPVSAQTALAQGAMSRITAYAFSFPALAGGEIRLADYAGRPFWSSTPRRCADTRHNTPDCRNCGPSFTTEA